MSPKPRNNEAYDAELGDYDSDEDNNGEYGDGNKKSVGVKKMLPKFLNSASGDDECYAPLAKGDMEAAAGGGGTRRMRSGNEGICSGRGKTMGMICAIIGVATIGVTMIGAPKQQQKMLDLFATSAPSLSPTPVPEGAWYEDEGFKETAKEKVGVKKAALGEATKSLDLEKKTVSAESTNTQPSPKKQGQAGTIAPAKAAKETKAPAKAAKKTKAPVKAAKKTKAPVKAANTNTTTPKKKGGKKAAAPAKVSTLGNPGPATEGFWFEDEIEALNNEVDIEAPEEIEEEDEEFEIEEDELEETYVEEKVEKLKNPSLDDLEGEFPMDISAMPQTSRFDAVTFLIRELGISDVVQMSDENSPASQAIMWISQIDSLQLPVPGLDHQHGEAKVYWSQLTQLLQRYALATFYFGVDSITGLGKAPVEVQANRKAFDAEWLQHTSVCKWHGVTCEQNQVASLNLTHAALFGTLPTEIIASGALPRLQKLDLSFNHIRGHLPFMKYSEAFALKVVEGFDALKILDLSHNQISGSTHPLRALRNLSVVNLSQNLFHGSLSPAMAGLVHLEKVILDHNDLTGSIPAAFGQLSSLDSLFLDDNSLVGMIPTSLANLQNLVNLRLYRNHLEGTVPAEVCLLKEEGKLHSFATDCEHGDITCDCCSMCF